MSENIGLDIAGVPFVIAAESHEILSVMKKRYHAFLCEPSKTVEYRWTVKWDHKRESGRNPGVRFQELDGKWRIHDIDMDAEWDPRTGQGQATFRPDIYVVDSWLRVWLSTMLLNNQGGLFHSAGVVHNERGALFLGPSGSGKTTLSRKCDPQELLSDELVALRRHGDKYRVYGTPFMGELAVGGVNVSAPLERFFVLRKDLARGRAPIKPARAAAELWGTLMCFYKSHSFLSSALSFCEDMANALPCESFSFDLERDLWRQLDDG